VIKVTILKAQDLSRVVETIHYYWGIMEEQNMLVRSNRIHRQPFVLKKEPPVSAYCEVNNVEEQKHNSRQNLAKF
jgi:hypothetical protein